MYPPLDNVFYSKINYGSFYLLVPIRDVEAVLGGRAELPCDILPEDAHDDVYLVLWFKENATKPMYRYVLAFYD